MNLYEISDAIMDCVDTETGEIIDAEKLGNLQMAYEKKVENIALWIKNLLADAAAIKTEKDALAEREKACRNKAESLKNYLSSDLDGSKFSTPRVAISWRKSETVEIDDATVIPSEYWKVKTDLDKMGIKKALKAGAQVSGARIVTNNNIQIK